MAETQEEREQRLVREALDEAFGRTERLPQNDPTFGDMFDGTISGQNGTTRPRDYGYFEFEPEQRFQMILSTYLTVMNALDHNDISNITDQEWNWFGWGLNDQDALDVGLRLSAEEGWGEQYVDWFGTGASELTGWPRYDGTDGSWFEEQINKKLDSIETIDRASRVPKPTVWRTLSKDKFGIGGTPGTAQWAFNAALHGGNMSELQQGVDKNALAAGKVAGAALAVYATGSLIGTGIAATQIPATLARVGTIVASTPAGKAMVRQGLKFKDMVFGPAQQPGVNATGYLDSGSRSFVEGAKMVSPYMGQVARTGMYGTLGGAVLAYTTSMALGMIVDTPETVFDDLKRALETGAIDVESAKLLAIATSGTTGVPIPDYLLSEEGFEEIAASKESYQKAKIEATSLMRDKMVKPILNALQADIPQPVTGEAADWDDSIVLAMSFGMNLFDVPGSSFDAPPSEDGTAESSTTTTTTPPPSDADASTEEDETVVEDGTYEGGIDSESVDSSEELENALDFEAIAGMTLSEREAEIRPWLDTWSTEYEKFVRDDSDNDGKSDDEIDQIVNDAVLQQEEIIAEALVPDSLRLQRLRHEAFLDEQFQAEQARGMPVGGMTPYMGIRPTITKPGPAPGSRDPSQIYGSAGASITPESAGAWARQQSDVALPRYYDNNVEAIIGNWSTQQIQWFQDQAIQAGMINPDGGYRIGQRDAETRRAFDQIISDANNNGNTWEDQLQGNIDGYQQWKADNGAGDRDPYEAFVAPTYISPDYASLAQATKTYADQLLGRRMSEAEMALLTGQLSGYDKQQWDSQVQGDRQTHAARARVYDQELSGPGGEQSGGTTQGVDAQARFQQFFDDKFSGEIKHRERVDQAQGKNAGFFGSINNVEGNL